MLGPSRYLGGQASPYLQGTISGYNSYAAGSKNYGGRSPNFGPVGSAGQMGYAERDSKINARRNAILRRMKASDNKAFAGADFNRSI